MDWFDLEEDTDDEDVAVFKKNPSFPYSLTVVRYMSGKTNLRIHGTALPRVMKPRDSVSQLFPTFVFPLQIFIGIQRFGVQ